MFNKPPDFFQTILVNQPNFRDLGAIPTADGRSVKPGLLYRSGDLSKLSEEDIINLEQMGIRMIIDFRSDREVIKYPTPRIPGIAETKRIVIVDSARDVAEKMLNEDDAEGLETILVKDYRRLVNDHQDDFREFFRVLATTDQLPLMYHCAAGKDRTGLATYLLLLALGVSESDARRDYLLSNVFLKPLAEKFIREVDDAGKNGEILRPLMEVREEYLDSALEEIELKYGGPGKYLYDLLEVDKEALQKKYLF